MWAETSITVGTIIAGALGDHLGVVLVLNIQGGVYVLAGVCVLTLLGKPLVAAAGKMGAAVAGESQRPEVPAEPSL